MTTEAWSGITLTSVAATGVITQLYPTWVTAGVAKAGSTIGQLIRLASEGVLHSIQIKPDGQNGGYIEFWDLNGADAGVDVSSATAITDAQRATITMPTVPKLIYREDFMGSEGAGGGLSPVNGMYRTFMRGLAARYVSDAGAGVGTIQLNLVCNGGFQKVESRGSY